MSDFTLYPAIDVREGRVVRLRQGDYAQETRYAEDPLELASRYAAAGARWLHLVDLDAARAGGYTLAPLLDELKRRTRLKVQTGGGVRGEVDVESLLAAGADRVVVGSLAVREPGRVASWVARYGAERITVALDTRRDAEGRWRLPVHGWTEEGGRELDVLAAAYDEVGLRHLLCTDISRDGMLSGPNFELYRYLCQRFPRLRVQASGGVADAGEVATARASGCGGIVLGKALLDGRFTLEDVIAEQLPC
jgi:phosphoribosylformimino-5-aminoimidazole carboxamide ribotide isomerase